MNGWNPPPEDPILKDEWGTPQEFFDELDNMFEFTLDPCANEGRLLKEMLHITKEKIFHKGTCTIVEFKTYLSGLKYDWTGHSVFVNPPYSGRNLELWIRKCYEERHRARDIVLLMPSNRTGTEYFHCCVLGSAEIFFVRGRLKFVPLAGQKEGSNPMNNIVAVWQSSNEKTVELEGALNNFEERW